MKLFPSQAAKPFGDCQHGEFVVISIRNQLHAGICIREEDDTLSLLIVQTEDPDLLFTLCETNARVSALSYGNDWSLSPYKHLRKTNDAYEELGAVLVTDLGTFMVGRPPRGTVHDFLLCRLDAPDVRSNGIGSDLLFAYQYWRIHVFDEAMQTKQKLAGKDEPSDD